MELDFSICREVPLADGTMSPVKEHAKLGVKAIVQNPFFGLFDEMGGMKSAQSIIAAQFLYLNNTIDNVLIVAPSSVRPVWFDPELGELAKHLFPDMNASIMEYHAKNNMWRWGKFSASDRRLKIVITNYEFIRSKSRLMKLRPFCNPKTLLILDESSSVKNWRAEQTKACEVLRKDCGRIVILNGTPIANSPMDMFSQGHLMHPSILGMKTFFHFRAHYAMMGGWQGKQIIAYQNLEELQTKFKPYVLRRLKKDCLDLPEALPPVTLTVPLKEETWKIYKEMRDEMVAWLSENTVAVASQAAVKSMRLAQITSGFVGGVEDAIDKDADIENEEEVEIQKISKIEEVGREKLDFFLNWHKERMIEDPDLKMLVWCRFIPELKRFLEAYYLEYPQHPLGCCAGRPLLGMTKKDERNHVLRLLDPRTAPKGPVTVAGTYGTGSLGHNFTACHTMLNMSYDYSHWKSLQAAARVDRPGQLHAVSYFDIVAVGPNGQKTIDHLIVKARRGKEEIANWTCAAWVKGLMEE